MKLDRDYLSERTSVEEVVAEYDLPTCNAEFRADWDRLLAKKREGDELWRFAPPPGKIEVWGVALVRDDQVIATLIESVG